MSRDAATMLEIAATVLFEDAGLMVKFADRCPERRHELLDLAHDRLALSLECSQSEAQLRADRGDAAALDITEATALAADRVPKTGGNGGNE